MAKVFVMDSLIGVPFEWGGRGPDTLDCYGLVKNLYEAEYPAVTLPEYMSPDNSTETAAMMAGQIDLWKRVEEKPNVVVLIRVRGMASHVGYTLGDDKFIHTWESSGGVVIERLSQWKRKIIGYYEYVGK